MHNTTYINGTVHINEHRMSKYMPCLFLFRIEMMKKKSAVDMFGITIACTM